MIGIIKVAMSDIIAEMADIGLIRARIEMVVGMEGAKIQERENGETVQVTKATKNQTTQDQNRVILTPDSPETTIEILRATTQTLMARRRISDVSAGTADIAQGYGFGWSHADVWYRPTSNRTPRNTHGML